MEMQEQIKQLLIDSLENETGIGKTGAEMKLTESEDEMLIEFDLIVSIKAITVNGNREEY